MKCSQEYNEEEKMICYIAIEYNSASQIVYLIKVIKMQDTLFDYRRGK